MTPPGFGFTVPYMNREAILAAPNGSTWTMSVEQVNDHRAVLEPLVNDGDLAMFSRDGKVWTFTRRDRPVRVPGPAMMAGGDRVEVPAMYSDRRGEVIS